MVSREEKKAVLQEKLQLLRAVTHSQAQSSTGIIADASIYIQDLKQKVDECTQYLLEDDALPMVTVERVEKGSGFLINVASEKNAQRLLVSVLETLEELGLDVLDATISCAESFRLEAVGRRQNQDDNMDAQIIRQSVVEAIKSVQKVIEDEVA